MSDQTPETSESQGHEPSMEDILSSIRQMIDADDIGVNVPVEEETSASESLEPTSLVKAVQDSVNEQKDEPVNPFDILESLTEDDSQDDLEIPEISAFQEDLSVTDEAEVSEEINIEVNSVIEEEPDLVLSDDIVLADDDVLILEDILETETDDDGVSPLNFLGVDEASSDMDLVIDDEDENLLELISDISDEVELNIISEPAETDISTANVTGDADIDLVKSLMADLTDDDMMDVADDDLDDSHLDLMDADTETELPSGSAFLAIARQATAEADAAERNRSSEPLNITPDLEPEISETYVIEDIPVQPEPSVKLDHTAIEEADDDLEIWVVGVDDEAESTATLEDTVTEAVTQQIVKDILETEEQETQGMARAAEETIIDNDTEADTSSAFASLAQVVQQQEDGAYMGPHIGELVTEAMKPMLKEWLDKNLKGIVERAVTKEVKRISGGK